MFPLALAALAHRVVKLVPSVRVVVAHAAALIGVRPAARLHVVQSVIVQRCRRSKNRDVKKLKATFFRAWGFILY